MANETQKDPRTIFPLRFLPWLLGVAMFAAFAVTLNRWINLTNIGQVATISGYVWQPQLYTPLMWLATYPFHWLAPAHVPLALNFFSAACGALTLTVLARSVALLPHDRTDAERQRERSAFSFLTSWVAWFPPVLAVLLCGLQLTFWENATSFSGESFDLLLFAVVVWQLLEYRIDENEGRLFAVAFLYGAGITESWAFISFFPLFLAAIIWLKKLEFFHLRFLNGMLLGGLAGLSLLFLLPLVAKFSGPYSLSLWEGLRPGLSMDWKVLKAFGQGPVRHNLALMSLSTLLPVLVMAIRWSSNFGDNSRMGVALVNNLFHLVFAVLFGVCTWVMFDPPFSPHDLAFGTPSLTLYYLAALSVGYFSGYFILVFAKKPVVTRRTANPLPILPPSLMWLCPVIVAGVFLAAIAAVGMLAYKNLPAIRNFNDNTLLQYAQYTTQNLPPGGAVLLCDSDNTTLDQPTRAYLVQAELAREGRAQDYPVVDTQSLNWAPYHRYLHKHFPKQWPLLVGEKEMGGVSPLGLLGLLNLVAKTNALYYLNPSFGYYFESFYQEPHGLDYAMKLLPNDTLLPPPLDKNLLAENESFWAGLVETVSPKIELALAPPNPNARKTFTDRLLRRLHTSVEPNPNAILVGTYYSRSLNYWGVQLQRAGELAPAAALFTAAQKLNPDNINAGINLDFNRTLRSGSTAPVEIKPITADQFGKFHNWNEVIGANGPFDEPSFCSENGVNLVQGGLLRQAVVPFTRVRQLAPDNAAARLWLGQIYLFARQPDRALEAMNDLMMHPQEFGLNETNSTEINVLASAAYFQKNENALGIELIETEVRRHPDDDTLLTAAAQSFFMRGFYTNALHIVDRKLAQSPDDTQWLFGKGYASLQIGAYNQAIAAFNHLLEIQTNDPTTLFNRALAYLDSDKLELARADYRQLQASYTNSFQVAYGLAEIAWRQHETNEAIQNYQIYLANAPTNSAEFQTVRQRLTQLGGQ
jgi:tetratricopeptide (TPR) repeat protein